MDAVLVHRVAEGTDHALRLSVILNYAGVDGTYTLARAFGLTAMIFAYVTVLLGLAVPGSATETLATDPLATDLPTSDALATDPGTPQTRTKTANAPLTTRRGRAPGALHRQIGVTTLALVAAHAAVPYASVVPPYGGWRTAFVPWSQPVSWGIKAASWESLGILAFFLLVLTGPTFYLVRRRRGTWKVVHRLAVVAYALSVGHVLLLGTDFLVAGPARVALIAAQIPVLVLLCRKLAPVPPGYSRQWDAGVRGLRWAAAVVAGAAAAGFAALTVLSATGEYAGGMRL